MCSALNLKITIIQNGTTGLRLGLNGRLGDQCFFYLFIYYGEGGPLKKHAIAIAIGHEIDNDTFDRTS